MLLFRKNQRHNTFIGKYEHSVMPSLDYLFAKEFYDPSDNRYQLVKTFEKIIWKAKKIKIYNCKIELIKSSNDSYNVYVYLYDLKKTLGNDYNPFFNKNMDFVILFKKALKECPIEELANKKMNPNGIFMEDFLTCARCYAINRAFKKLNPAIKRCYPTIEFVTIWDETIYLFFKDSGNMEVFLKGNISSFKKFCYDIIEPLDAEHALDASNLTFMLDIHENYTSIGGGNYFNSDAMSAGVFI